MKKIINKRHFCAGLISTGLATACIIVALLNTQNLRFIIGAVILLVLAAVNYRYAFSKKDVAEEILGFADERERYIAMKSCQAMVQIVNYLLLGGCQLSLILYGAFRLPAFLIVAITLCSVLVLMFVVTLLANMYFDRHA